MTELLIVRHGNTFGPGDTVLRIGARTDLPLSSSGIRQAEALGRYLAEGHRRVDAIVSSPLKRTTQTAAMIAAALDPALSVGTEPFLTELDHGHDEGRPEADVIARIGEAAITLWEREGIPPDGWQVDAAGLIEGWKDFFSRVSRDWPDGRVVAVTSNGIARYALEATGNAAGHPRKLRTGAFGVIDIGAGRQTSVRSWDERP